MADMIAVLSLLPTRDLVATTEYLDSEDNDRDGIEAYKANTGSKRGAKEVASE